MVSVVEAGKVVSYLKNEDNVRDPKKPFFIMVGMNPPHSPYRSLDDCMEEGFNLYKDQPLDSLLVRPNADPKMEKAESVRYYFASVTGVDRAFGKILDALKELGLDKNTIVVFASDHGETMCSQRTNDPKNSPYSESMNTPFLVRYPDKLKPRVDNLMMSSPDIMPTLLGLQAYPILFLRKYKDVTMHHFSSMKRQKLCARPVPFIFRTWMEKEKLMAKFILISPHLVVSSRLAIHWHSTLIVKTISL